MPGLEIGDGRRGAVCRFSSRDITPDGFAFLGLHRFRLCALAVGGETLVENGEILKSLTAFPLHR